MLAVNSRELSLFGIAGFSRTISPSSPKIRAQNMAFLEI